jgi:predicted NUDIX family NTP pyrophosphohydrolase
MPRISAGILLYRHRDGGLELLLVHMGGPFWARKDEGAWTIPKGEPLPGEELLTCALREFTEETGFPAPSSVPLALPPIRQAGGKHVHAFAMRGDADPEKLRSNSFPTEWPPRSGRLQLFPEADRAAWFDPETACRKLVKAQAGLVQALGAALAGGAASIGGAPK